MIKCNAPINLEDLHNPDTRDQALVNIGQWVIDTCLVFGCRPCGPDAWRYLDNRADYLACIEQYLASGWEHRPLGQQQMRMPI